MADASQIVDPKTGEGKQIKVSVDEGIRPETTMSVLSKLKPALKNDGTTTAGNSSQLSDGAGAVLLMRRDVATQKGLPIEGVFRSFSAVGVEPTVMGIGPSVAIPAAVRAAGLKVEEIDLFEINEAFASQFVYCCKKLQLDPEKVNVNGGAIALGHPLGATGTFRGFIEERITSANSSKKTLHNNFTTLAPCGRQPPLPLYASFQTSFPPPSTFHFLSSFAIVRL